MNKATEFKEFEDLRPHEKFLALHNYSQTLKKSGLLKIFSVVLTILFIIAAVSGVLILWRKNYELMFRICATSTVLWAFMRLLAAFVMKTYRTEIALMIKMRKYK